MLDYLNQAERVELLEEFNATASDYPKDKTVVDLFEEQALRTPENIALVYEEQELSYGEVNAISNQLAGYLRHHYRDQGGLNVKSGRKVVPERMDDYLDSGCIEIRRCVCAD